MVVAPELFLALALAVQAPGTPAPTQHPGAVAETPALVLRQAGEADVVGADDVALQAALDRLRGGGGSLTLGPGRYLLRRQVMVPSDIVLRGEEGAVLALPSPVRVARAAEVGEREIVVEGAHEFAAGTRVQMLPPDGGGSLADEERLPLEFWELERVEGATLHLGAPLAVAVPAGSRVGYPHKLLWIHKEGRVLVEGLAFEGGRVDSIPMPGHSQRCGIWASAPYGYGDERLGPPGRGIVVRHCRFSGFYGRGVAFYNHEDGRVEGCLFEHISDEAIDLDHYVQGFQIVGNEVRDALWGIVLNDASRNLVEFNHVQDVEIGIWSWRYERMPAHAVYNAENVVRHNVVRGARVAAIDFGATCSRNVIEFNHLEGALRIAEPDNRVGRNTLLDALAPEQPDR
jgi:hypothetical protein